MPRAILFVLLLIVCHVWSYQISLPSRWNIGLRKYPYVAAYARSNRLRIPHQQFVLAAEETSESTSTRRNPLYKASQVLYKFSRPHTIKGTILASTMAVGRALVEHPTRVSSALVQKAFVGLLALMCGNAYIVGINQIYDEKIDQINKPFLPIAAKELTRRSAWLIVWTSLVAGVSIVKHCFSPLIFKLYVTGGILGTVYSVPPLQLKRYPLCAAAIIATVRGFLLNFGVYYAVREALGVTFRWNPVVIFIAGFMTVFASVIAVTKDLSDVKGDKQYSISTFASRFGVQRTAAAASAILAVAYMLAAVVPFILPGRFRRVPMVVGHVAYLAFLLKSYGNLDGDDQRSIGAFYRAIWTLFYLEYLLYPFI